MKSFSLLIIGATAQYYGYSYPDPTYTCADDFCGGWNGCYCDNYCHIAGDCCEDILTHCGGFDPDYEYNYESEYAYYGFYTEYYGPYDENVDYGYISDYIGPFGETSYDPYTYFYTDSDYSSSYDGLTLTGTCVKSETETYCGGQFPIDYSATDYNYYEIGCFCDNVCFTQGDCCSDKDAVCGEYDEGYSYDDYYYPYYLDDFVYVGQCAVNDGEPICDNQFVATGENEIGCWCDHYCLAAGDCCDDKVAECGEVPEDFEEFYFENTGYEGYTGDYGYGSGYSGYSGYYGYSSTYIDTTYGGYWFR